MPKLVIFDLDGTLAESKQPLTDEMAALLAKLLMHTKAAIVSGGALSQLLTQVVNRLPQDAHLENLYLLPTSGAALYERRAGDWKKVYEERLTEAEAAEIEKALQVAVSETGVVDLSAASFGPRTEYRGSQVSFSALGQQAPLALKKEWDPDRKKRTVLAAALTKLLPHYTPALGGTTTIDITKKGIDKAYGIHRLADRLHLPEQDILYLGDELIAGGNDEAVYKTNAQVRAVAAPEETARVIVSLVP